jgi:phosphoribosylformylglycinamidine (FGAM) synthase PurS component
MAENRKKVLLNFELKCNDQGQKRTIKAMTDFNPLIPNSLITNYSTEFDESESVNIIQQLSEGEIQVAKTGKAFELRLEADNFEFTLNIKPKYQRHWGQSFVEKVESARKKMGYGIATGSDVS